MSDPNLPEHEQDEWADALAEQGAAGELDPWAEALAEQAQTVTTPAENQVFKPLDSVQPTASPRELEMIMDIPVKLSVELGLSLIHI